MVDIGPGAGVHGGKVCAEGDFEKILKDKNSITGKFLSKKREIKIPKKRAKPNGKFIEIKSAFANNLNNIDIEEADNHEVLCVDNYEIVEVWW